MCGVTAQTWGYFFRLSSRLSTHICRHPLVERLLEANILCRPSLTSMDTSCHKRTNWQLQLKILQLTNYIQRRIKNNLNGLVVKMVKISACRSSLSISLLILIGKRGHVAVWTFTKIFLTMKFLHEWCKRAKLKKNFSPAKHIGLLYWWLVVS